MEENLNNLDIKTLAIIAVSGIVALFGLYKVLRSSITLVFWIVLVIGGVFGVTYSLRPDFTSNLISEMQSGQLIDKIPTHRLEAACERLYKKKNKEMSTATHFNEEQALQSSMDNQ